MRLHKIQVEKISLLLLNKYDVHNFCPLPVVYEFSQFKMFTQVYHTFILYKPESR